MSSGIHITKLKNYFNSMFWLYSVSKCCRPGYFSYSGKIFLNSMTGRKLEVDTEETPKKKLCTESEKGISTQRVKKRHVALLLSYSGANYHGMQINCGFKTIEGELLQALHNSNAIPDEAIVSPQRINFQRAARTDKSVSAVKQVVSFFIGKFQVQDGLFSGHYELCVKTLTATVFETLITADNFCIDNINQYLPEDIKVFSIKRVTKGFSSKNFCSARTYSYTLPTFALARQLHEEFPQNYRIDNETIQKVNDILKSYTGSNLYHNFTSKKNHDDPSARRYVVSFTSEIPFIENEEEFITLTIKGQSFMLHQIRKMVGHLIAILKGKTSEEIEKNVWKAEKYAVPLAPGLGLVLEDIHYDMYNKKYGNDGIHEALVWDDIADELNNFKKTYILPNIIKREIEEKLMFNWILKLKDHSYELEDIDTNKDNVVNLSEERN